MDTSKHQVQGFRMTPSSKSSLPGSESNPFESAQALLSYLEDSEPEKYIFRGQVQKYEGPLLPTGYRKWFRPFGGPDNQYAGVTYTYGERREIANKIVREVIPDTQSPPDTTMDVIDLKSALSLLNNAFNMNMLDYLPTPELDEAGRTLWLSQGRSLVVLSAIVGPQLGLMLGQQYGLTSTLLDVTTNPKVAMFFATHKYPYYHPIKSSDELGVIYRWPKKYGIIAADHFAALESGDYQSLGKSIQRFFKKSKSIQLGFKQRKSSLDIGKEDNFGNIVIHGSNLPQRCFPIIVTGEKRSLESLLFPKGAFANSRMGRQGAAFLYPKTKEVFDLSPSRNERSIKTVGDQCTLIADLIKTCGGEVFYFKHTGDIPDLGLIDKFYLWPLQEHPVIVRKSEKVRYVPEKCPFQDKFMELLLRLLSPHSPFMLVVFIEMDQTEDFAMGPVLTIGGKKYVFRSPGGIHIKPGFTIHPDEAESISFRLLKEHGLCEKKDIYSENLSCRDHFENLINGPISFPIDAFIRQEDRKDFYTNFNMSISRFLK